MALLSLGRNVALEAKILQATEAPAPPGKVEATEIVAAASREAGMANAGRADAARADAGGAGDVLDAVEAAANAAGERAAELIRATGNATTEANKKLADARRGIADTLAPWIPGDFLVIYGTLLTAWSGLRADFWAMVVVTVASAVLFVFLGAAAESGWGSVGHVAGTLVGRVVIGAAVSAYACFAVPGSGWYEFSWVREHESSVVLSAGLGVAVIVLFLKSLPKAWGGTR